MTNSFSLAGKTILVTGASTGIGRAVCDQISDLGGQFVAVARREDKLKTLLASHASSGHRLIAYDLAEKANCQTLVDQLEQIDGFVHSAGQVTISPVKFMKQETLQSIMNVNYYSFVWICQALLKKKKLNKGASIIGLSSISASHGMKGNGMYASSKAALEGFSKTLAAELSNQEIRVNNLSLGLVNTQMADYTESIFSQEQLRADAAKYPLGHGSVIDAVNPILFLLSDASRWITGQTIVVDGGRTSVL